MNFKWLGAAILLVILVWYLWPRPPSTTLELESNGGFAYLQWPNEMDIAYLKKIDNAATGCHVPESRVRLWVVRGKVVAPAATPEQREFDLLHTMVQFADLDSSPDPLVINRSAGPRPTAPPFGPVPSTDVMLWKDLKWLPRVYDLYASPHVPPSALDTGWASKVDGHVVLTHGTIEGAHPSDVVVRDALFEFKKSAGGPVEFTQALTDRTLFKVTIPKPQIVIKLTESTGRVSTIVVQPEAPGQPVKLKMIGLHDEMTPPSIPLGMPVQHFCGFYELLQPVPTDQMLPYFAGNPTLSAAYRAGQPSPGPLCPGDFD
jgi:hypothetical protein